MNQAVTLSSSSKLVPYSLEAEAACLGTLLINNYFFDDVFAKLSPEDFYDGRNKIIARILIEYRQEKGEISIDLITLIEELKKKELLKKSGGLEYINSLVDVVPSTTNVKDYVGIVIEKSLLRKIILISSQTIDEAKHSIFSSDLLDKTMNKFFELSFEQYKEYEHINVALKSTLELIENNYRNKGFFGISSGYKDLDKLIVGFQNSNLIIIGGRTGMGKTAFALNIIERIAFPKIDKNNEKVGVGIFSLEMSKSEICMRILSNQAEISLNQFKDASFDDTKWHPLINSVDNARLTNILIDDTPGISIRELASKARKMVREGIKIIFVDYLQLITENENQISREQQISSVSKQLKNLARSLDIPIVALTQLNRSVDSREDKVPRLSDIRESGAIEQDADLVMFIHRVDKKKNEDEYEVVDEKPHNFFDNVYDTKIYISKNRHGPTGSLDLEFVGKYLRFQEKF